VLALSLVEHDLQAAEEEHHQGKAHPVHIEPVGKALPAFPLEHLRLDQERPDEHEREEADRAVDEEYPVPGKIIRDPAAKRGADGRRNADGNTEDAESLAALARREAVGKDRLADWHHAAAAKSLEHAKGNQPAKARRQSAEDRAYREQHHADHVEALAA